MGQLDISEKLLEDYEDVFADIVNVLLFDGERLVKEKDLIPAQTDSQYKADDERLHEQERDVAKYWDEGEIRIALLGLENQTNPDEDMPLRVLNYEGAAYRSQMLKGKKERYPVVTLVLYFGLKRWNKSINLYNTVKPHDRLKPFVNDYRINLFEIAYLSDEQVKMFQSDFGIVAEYFTLARKKQDPREIMGDKKIHHVDATLKMMTAMTGDKRFCDTIGLLPKKGGQTMDITMNLILDQVEKKGADDKSVKLFIKCRRRGMSVKESKDFIEMDDALVRVAEERFQKNLNAESA